MLTSRRSTKKQTQATQQLITFRIQKEWFALPIQVVYRVVPLGQVYGTSYQGGMSLTHFENREIPVVDIKYRLFGDSSHQSVLPSSATHATLQQQPGLSAVDHQQYLLVINDLHRGEFIGIPLDFQPSLRRVPNSAFTPLPASYMATGTIRCVSASVTLGENQPSLLLLNLNQLLELPSYMLSR